MLNRLLVTLAASLVLAGSLLFHGCGGGGNAGNTVKIGSLQSFTGEQSAFGKSTHNGILLAMEERNKAGGVLGKPVEIILSDDQSKTDLVHQCVLKLISQDKVCAILGEVASGRTAAASEDCQRNHVPLLTPSSTRNDITDAGDYIFRSCFKDEQQGKWMVELASETLKFTRGALLVDIQSPYSVGLAKVIREEFTRRGGTILREESYSSPAKDFQTQLTNIRAVNPQFVFLPGYYSEVVNILPQARKLDMNYPFVGGDGWDAQETLDIGKEAVNGCYFTNHYCAEDPDEKVATFVKKYRAHFDNQTPDAMAVTGYDAANLLFDAVGRAGSTEGGKIRDALAATKDFQGVTGSISIDKNRNASKPGVVIKIDNGHFVLFKKMGASQ